MDVKIVNGKIEVTRDKSKDPSSWILFASLYVGFLLLGLSFTEALGGLIVVLSLLVLQHLLGR